MVSKQYPIGSGFTAASTAEDVIAGMDLRGKVALVTGGYSNIGLEAARVLAGAGASVIVPARDLDRARANLAGIANIEIEPMDLMDPASIDALADRFLASGRPLHILINSAGIMANPLTRDGRGYESQFSTNHLGHFQLAARLWPALKKADGARVVAVSSRGHRIAPVDFDDPNFTRRAYDRWQAYGQAKTANVLFALGLDQRGEAHGVRAFALHPGVIISNLARHLSKEEVDSFDVYDEAGNAKVEPERDVKNRAQGAATSVWCAVSPQLDGMGGVYCENSDIAEVVEIGANGAGVYPWAVDPQAADKLWALSEELTGVSFRP